MVSSALKAPTVPVIDAMALASATKHEYMHMHAPCAFCDQWWMVCLVFQPPCVLASACCCCCGCCGACAPCVNVVRNHKYALDAYDAQYVSAMGLRMFANDRVVTEAMAPADRHAYNMCQWALSIYFGCCFPCTCCGCAYGCCGILSPVDVFLHAGGVE